MRSTATVDPNEIYHYGIYAIYAMSDGRLFPSPGVVVSARPQPPVSALEAPRLLLEPGGRVRIDWIEPARGSVKIMRTAHPLPHAAGTRLTMAEAEALDGRLDRAGCPRSGLRPRPAGRGALLLHAADCLGGHLHRWPRCRPQPRRGSVRACARRRTGTGLGAGSGETRVTLRWRWSAEASACLVVARQGTPPLGPNDPAAVQATVYRADYDRQDCWTLNLPSSRPADNGDWSPPPLRQCRTPASEPGNSRRWTLAYQGLQRDRPGWSPLDLTGPRAVRRDHLARTKPGGHGFVCPEAALASGLAVVGRPFEPTPPGSVVPPMVLVAHPRAVPLSVDDGQIVAHFPAGRDGAHFPIRTPLNLSQHGARVFPDPNVEPDALMPIRLRHPESGTTRV